MSALHPEAGILSVEIMSAKCQKRTLGSFISVVSFTPKSGHGDSWNRQPGQQTDEPCKINMPQCQSCDASASSALPANSDAPISCHRAKA